MASIVRVPVADFTPERLDTGYYSEEFYAARELIKGAGLTLETIGSICEPWQFGAYALCNEIVWAERDRGVPFIKAEAIESPLIDVDALSFITPATHSLLSKSALNAGDIIVSTSGTVGRLAVLPESIPSANSNQDTIKFSLRGTAYDSHFVAAWLTSTCSQAFMNREAGGAVQQHIYLYNFKRLPLLKLQAGAQKYIGEKVRQAERLRTWAKEIESSIAGEFQSLVEDPVPPRLSWRASTFDLDAYRINPKQYDPVVLDLLDRARENGIRLQPLAELFSERDIAGGATPKGAQYFTRGVLFARVQNVKPLRLDLSDAVFIDQRADNELARSRCAADDIILSITGYPGTASLVTAEDLPVNINQHSVRFGVKEGVSAAYVCAALNSKFLKYQVDRLAIGGTRDALDYPSVSRLLIPRFDVDRERAIDESARDFVAALKLAQRLTVAARALVEGLVERVIDEQHLIDAQQRLDAGDDQADRSILVRLMASGLDRDGQPLFADLDSVYDLLDQASER
jgi:type I restriction enzyme, S subunit